MKESWHVDLQHGRQREVTPAKLHIWKIMDWTRDLRESKNVYSLQTDEQMGANKK